MPFRDNQDLEDYIAYLEHRIRLLETHEHGPGGEVTQGDIDKFPAYSWQSAFSLVPGPGHKLHADRNGTIIFCRAERSAGDGSSTAVFNVYKNGNPIFTTRPKPIVPAGEPLGPERTPNHYNFNKDDAFHVDVEETGGGSGPLRVTIKFVERK